MLRALGHGNGRSSVGPARILQLALCSSQAVTFESKGSAVNVLDEVPGEVHMRHRIRPGDYVDGPRVQLLGRHVELEARHHRIGSREDDGRHLVGGAHNDAQPAPKRMPRQHNVGVCKNAPINIRIQYRAILNGLACMYLVNVLKQTKVKFPGKHQKTKEFTNSAWSRITNEIHQDAYISGGTA
eukprot:scaffold351702_cov46-Prasinocladus_malaysianus.AAC.1